jgi:hypothetical protein
MPDSEAFDPILLADIRASVPPMRPQFRAQLDDRVARGFQSAGGTRSWLSAAAAKAAPHRRMLLPAMAVATTLIVALVVAVSAVRDSRDDNTFAIKSGPPAAAVAGGTAEDSTAASPPVVHTGPEPGRAPLSESDAITAAAAPAPTAGALSRQSSKPASAPGFGRKVEHRTELSLSTPNDKLQDTADGVVHVTQGVGGIVERSSVNSSDGGGTASFTLSIPSGRLADAVKQLSKLAHVSSMSQGATDITKSFVSAASNLSDARAERKALLKALGVARTPERIATLKARLRDNRSEMAYYNGQLKSLRRRTDNTTVNVSLTGDGKAPASTGGGWSLHDAGNDTLKVLEVVASIIMISAAILVPLGLLGLLAALASRSVTRRRREQALQG